MYTPSIALIYRYHNSLTYDPNAELWLGGFPFLSQPRRTPCAVMVPRDGHEGGVDVHVFATQYDLETGRSPRIALPGEQGTFEPVTRRLQPRARVSQRCCDALARRC